MKAIVDDVCSRRKNRLGAGVVYMVWWFAVSSSSARISVQSSLKMRAARVSMFWLNILSCEARSGPSNAVSDASEGEGGSGMPTACSASLYSSIQFNRFNDCPAGRFPVAAFSSSALKQSSNLA